MKELKHVKLFEQFSQENSITGIKPIPLTQDPTLIVPDYIAKDGDFVVLEELEFPNVGFLNNDSAYQKRIEEIAEQFEDEEGFTVSKIPLKNGDSYLYYNQGDARGITQEELDSMIVGQNYTYIVSKDLLYYSEDGDGIGVVFSLINNPNQMIRAENHGAFMLETI